MFTGIIGYSQLMNIDEISALKEKSKEILINQNNFVYFNFYHYN